MKFNIVIVCFLTLGLQSSIMYSQQVISEQAMAIDDSLSIAVISIYTNPDIQEVTTISYKNTIYELDINTEKPITEVKHTLIQNEGKKYTLYVTELPLFQFHTEKTIVNEPKRMTSVSYIDKHIAITTHAGIELRGSSSLVFQKKTYDFNLYEDEKGTFNQHLAMDEMRTDDDWILDALYNEPIRLRSYLSFNIWNHIHKPYYLDREPKAKAGIEAHFTEVFINNSYKGLYLLTEQVDRKLLKIKKEQGDTIRGELFQGARYLGASSFDSLPEKKNYLLSWGGYDIKYPVPTNTPWDSLYEFTDFVLHSDDLDFEKEIASRFNIDNLIDYFLFINTLRAPDNLGKNIYIARYDIEEPYFYVPWDLDGTFGTIYSGKRVETTDVFLTNGLLRRLLLVNPNNFISRLKKRWLVLRKDILHTISITSRQRMAYERLYKNLLYEREGIRWGRMDNTSEELEYMQEWTKKRLLFLDQYFAGL
ncbi:CotH kinase family protein [Dokdonia sp.]|uniref:CotH kinase family protein n=1 Tax=Dokdonia sp. TaxID=2024995 RepID=UPI00326751A4